MKKGRERKKERKKEKKGKKERKKERKEKIDIIELSNKNGRKHRNQKWE